MMKLIMNKGQKYIILEQLQIVYFLHMRRMLGIMLR